MLKVTKNQGFTLSLEDIFFEKLIWRAGLGLTLLFLFIDKQLILWFEWIFDVQIFEIPDVLLSSKMY